MNHRAVIGLIAINILFLPGVLYPQQNTGGSVRIIQEPAIEQLILKHIRINETREGIPGYRIQIFFDSGTNSKIRATAVSEDFGRRFPEVNVYLTFIAPNYKVRIGDYRTRLDAWRFLQELQPDYPGAYVVADLINLSNIDNTSHHE